MDTRIIETSRYEEQKGQGLGFSKPVIAALFLLLTAASLLITGYQHIYGGNHPFQLVLVQRLNDRTLYPNDPFADTAYDYASALWYVVAWLSRFIDLSIVLFVFFLIDKFLFLTAGFRLARTFFPDSRYAPIAGMATLAIFPHVLFGGGYTTSHTQQTSLSVGALFIALDAFLNKRWFNCALWLGVAVNLNLMFSIFGLSYIAVSWLVQMHRHYSKGVLAGTVAAIAGGLLIGLPSIYLVLRAATHAEHDALSVWQACEISYPYHFYPQVWEIQKQIRAFLLAAAVLFVVYRFRDITPVGTHIVGWTSVAAGWYLIASLNPLLIHSLPLLHLHPVRALTLWQLPIAVFLVSSVVRFIERDNSPYNIRHIMLYFGLIMIVLFIDRLSYFMLLSLIAAVSIIICEIGRRFLPRYITGSQAFVLTVLVVLSVLLYSVANAFSSVLKGQNILSTVQHPAIRVAEWARNTTPKDAVFLIPIHNEGGWDLFRHLSQRNVFVHIKDGVAWPYAPWFADEWLERLAALGFLEAMRIDRKTYRIGSWVHIWSHDEKNFIRFYNEIDDDRVEKLRRQYRIDFWITRSNVATRFPKVYEHEGWKVLRLSD